MIIIEKNESPIEITKKEIIIEMSQRGPSGPRGLKGDTGPQGEKGDKGDKGDPGSSNWEDITGKPYFGALADHDTVDYETEVTNKPNLGALADHDTVDYETEVTNKPDLGSMAYEEDAPSDSEEYIRKNSGWERLIRDIASWGSIVGDISRQSDLNLALMGKASATHDHGNLNNGGEVGGGSFVITNGDRMLISDASHGNRLHMSNVIFDGTSTDKALTAKGTFESFAAPSMICSTESAMTATRNYISGDLIAVGRYLYKATAAIAAGSPLSVGTNVTQTTIEAEIDSSGGGGGASVWGQITGTLSDQTDLMAALNAKADAADLGTMAVVNDAPSDDKEYARKNGAWEEVVGGSGSSDWADITNKPSTFPPSSHTHDDRYYTETEVNTLFADLGDLASKNSVDWSTDIDNIPSTFTPSAHNHDDRYYTESEVDIALAGKAAASHTHDDRYYTESEIDTALSGKSDTNHNHDSAYSAIGHTHDDRYYTESEIDAALSGKSDTSHNHDSRYYTETEVDTALSSKANSADVYTKTAVDTALALKADTSSLGTMSAVNDAPSDSGYYVRQNASWVSLAALDNVGF